MSSQGNQTLETMSNETTQIPQSQPTQNPSQNDVVGAVLPPSGTNSAASVQAPQVAPQPQVMANGYAPPQPETVAVGVNHEKAPAAPMRRPFMLDLNKLPPPEEGEAGPLSPWIRDSEETPVGSGDRN